MDVFGLFEVAPFFVVDDFNTSMGVDLGGLFVTAPSFVVDGSWEFCRACRSSGFWES